MEQHSAKTEESDFKLTLDYPNLSSRELVYKITDQQQIFLSESSIYRIPKSRG